MNFPYKWKLALAYTLMLIGICGPLCGLVLEWNYQASLPRSPELKTGHVIPRNNHGVIVYYTEAEVSQLRNLWLGGMLIGAVGGLVQKYSK